MSNVFFISDLHLGHRRVLNFAKEFRGGCETVEEHDEWIIERWNSVVRPRDVVKVLGDVAFSKEGLAKVCRLSGNKHLVMGNHDKYPIEEYLRDFRILPGVVKYKGFWLSHAPIYPSELRGIKNIHGHVHGRSIPDDRYINVCVEPLGGVPIPFDEIAERY